MSSSVIVLESEDDHVLNSSLTPAIAWQKANYQVSEWSAWKRKEKCILKNLTGSFQAGTLNGLLGPSGAGKTTLLNLLSGTVTSGLCQQSQVYSAEKYPISFFIAQTVAESIVGELTVGQILQYAYRFKNESRDSAGEMEKAINKLLTDLLLDPTILERPFAVCSGGEQKRIAIGQELLSRQAPSFLFLDEPTTGLDSAAAYEVMSCLQALAKSQCITIIASIHAPNQATLTLFHQLYILAKGGFAIYSGPPSEIEAFLASQMKNPPLFKQQPPIEFLLKIASSPPSELPLSALATTTFNRETCALSPCLPSLFLQAASLPNQRKSFSISNLYTQLCRQLRVTFISQFRSLLTNQLLFLAIFALLGSIFNAEKARPSGCYSLHGNQSTACNSEAHLKAENLVKENAYYLSYVYLIIGMITMTFSTVAYSSHTTVFKAEHRNRWYSFGVFYLSSSLTFFLELTLNSAILTLITYFLSSQHVADDYAINSARLGLFFAFIFLHILYNDTIGQLVATIFVNSPPLAFLVVLSTYTVTILFNGLYIKFHRMGNYTLLLVNRKLGFAYLSQLMVYAIYGVDRCKAGTEYSWILLDYQVEEEKLSEYFWQVLVNIALLRLLSLVILFVKLNSFSSKKRRKISENIELTEKGKLKNQSSNWKIQFDKNENETGKMIEMNESESLLSEGEKQFRAYSANKILIAWRNLSLYRNSSLFEVPSEKEKANPILRNLNGAFNFGSLNALMGTSGAGKTSLLRVLSGQAKTRLSEGARIYLSKYTKITTCYITQEVSGHLMQGLTTKQMLIFASKLKNPQKGLDHEAIALKWLHQLDLCNTSETKVEKCSGGERKRLAVALELTALVMPNCICVDEPTSGLDTNAAEIVISTLRRLTRTNPITIITSIHQPTAEILFSFDQLYVLARGGVCLYSGPPTSIESHLAEISPIPQASSHFAIETLIKKSCSSHDDPTIRKLVKQATFQYESPASSQQLLTQTQLTPDGLLRNRVRFSLHSALILSHRYFYFIRGYLWRFWLLTLLNSLGYPLFLRLIFNSSMIHVSGCINLEEEDPNRCTKSDRQMADQFAIEDSLHYANFYTSIYMILLGFGSLINLYQELPYFINEHRNGWYSTGTFYLMKLLFELLPPILTNLLYVYIIDIYDPIVAPDGTLYWSLFILLTLAAIGYTGFAHVCALALPGNLPGQTLLYTGLFICHLILSNYLIPISSMHYVYQLLANFSISRYLLETVMLLQYGFGRCSPSEISSILYSMSVTDGDYYPDLTMLLINLLFYRFLAIYLLIRLVNPIENRRKRVARIAQYQEKLTHN